MPPDPNAPIEWSGEAAAPEKRRGKLDPESKARIQREHAAALTKPPTQVRAGVNLAWLAAAFKLDVRTVKVRLGDLQSIGKFGERKSDVYDFQDAVARLAKPLPDKFDRWMRGLRVQDMPTHLQESYWGALRKKQIWEENAGELWKTEDVLEVFGETFKTLKTTMQLWVDNLDTKGDMDHGQRERLTQMVDGLLDDLHSRLIEMPNQRRTPSSREDPDAIPDTLRPSAPTSVLADEDLIG